jgi:hypothetical protein
MSNLSLIFVFSTVVVGINKMMKLYEYNRMPTTNQRSRRLGLRKINSTPIRMKTQASNVPRV